MVLCTMFAALLAAGAFIRIPTPFAPLTLQSEFAIMAGLLLGRRRGAASAGLYMVLGLLGLPVFALGGGFGYVFQPTFGYIIGFVFGAYLVGLVVERSTKGTNTTYYLASLAGLAVIYLSGLIYVVLIQRFSLQVQTDLWALMKYYLLIPLPGDLILCVGTAVLAKRLRPVTKKYVELKKAAD